MFALNLKDSFNSYRPKINRKQEIPRRHNILHSEEHMNYHCTFHGCIGDIMTTHIKVGQIASITKMFTENHLLDFSELSQDFNPIHLDSEFAKESIFGRKIVHGMLVASLFSGLLGNKLPGQGSIYLGQTLKFSSPVYLGDEVTATVEVINVRTDKPIVTLRTYCCNADGTIVIDGEAVMKV